MGAGRRSRTKVSKQGKLKFTLHGEKLHGSWALVRMGGRAGDDGKNWLLIKHRDDDGQAARQSSTSSSASRAAWFPAATMDEIAADADRVWSSNGKAAAQVASRKQTRKTKSSAKTSANVDKRQPRKPLADHGERPGQSYRARDEPSSPTKFKPQLATLASRVPDGDDWLHELKFDGYRMLAFIENGKVRLVSRNGNDWTARFRAVADALEKLPIKNAILDGEVVSLDEQGISNFQQLQNSAEARRRRRRSSYYVFDVPHLRRLRPHADAAGRAQRSAGPVAALGQSGQRRHAALQRPHPRPRRERAAARLPQRDGRHHLQAGRQHLPAVSLAELAQGEMPQAAGVRHRRLLQAGRLARRLRGAAAWATTTTAS